MLAPSNTKKRRLTQPVMLVGICICILLLAGAVAGFYVYRGRTANKPIAAGNSPSAASSDANGPTQAQNKPSATTPINSQTAAQTAQPPQSSTPAPNANATVSHPTVAAAKSKSTDNPVPIQKASKPEDTQRPSQVSSTSGVLHYSGPPVRYGGTVVFSNLPAGRLKFSFDKQSWQPLISHQPDGTQKLILRSIKNEDQSQCDVRWELLQ
jgi:cytoskeletal protein RodZ